MYWSITLKSLYTMKKLILICSLTIFSLTAFAQVYSFTNYTVIQPNIFQLKLYGYRQCPVEYKGILYFDTQKNKVVYCISNSNDIAAGSQWEGITSAYYTGGFVGIGTISPAYHLDVSGTARFSNTLFVNSKLGINTLIPTEKLELLDRSLLIRSTTDNINWSFSYRDIYDRVDLSYGSGGPLYLFNGGNMLLTSSAGVVNGTDKLKVEGDASFVGDVTVGGYGTISSTAAAQLKLYPSSLIINTQFIVSANSCSTWSFSVPNGTFSSIPVVAIGNKISGNSFDEKMTMTVESVTLNTATIRFCNSSATPQDINGNSYSIIAIGQ